MPRSDPPSATKRIRRPVAPVDRDVESVIASLKRLATKKTRDAMARYAIPSDKALGVPVGMIRDLGKHLKKERDAEQNHALAAALWETGIYEARMLTAFIDDPALVTPAQMDRWCRDFDNWAVCDHLCFHLFDRTPHAFAKVEQWSDRHEEFVKRAAFALLASLALHDKSPSAPASNGKFARCLPLIEAGADDERNFVKKGVSWALRTIGRRNPELNIAALWLAVRLAGSPHAATRWVGQDVLRDLTRVRSRRRARPQKP